MGDINIYEVVSEQRRESLVVLTTLPRGKLIVRLAGNPPPEASQWRAEEFAVEQIAENIPADDAEQFPEAFSAKLRSADWRATVVRL